MRLGAGGRSFFASAALIVLFAVATDVLVARSIEDADRARVRAEATRLVDLIAERAAQEPLHGSDRIGWRAFASLLAKRARARVTFFAPDGRRWGDSAENPSVQDSSASNTEEPAEVAQALAAGHGSQERFSLADGRRMVFVAAPFVEGGQVAGVARVGVPLTGSVAGVHRVVALVALATLLCAFGFWSLVDRRRRASLDALSLAVQRMKSGDFATRVRVDASVPVESLSRSLEEMRRSVLGTLARVENERTVLGRVLDGMAEGVLLVDGEGKVALVNPALREMLLLGADVLGRTPLEVIRHPELHRLLEKSQANRSVESGEVELSGLKPRRLLIRVLPLSGEPAAQLAVFVDVTDRRRLENLRRDFVANVSHELRTPVTAVKSAAETLHDAIAKDPAAVPMFLDIIERNAERLRRLVEDLLDLSRIDAREYRLNPERLNVAQAVEQALALFRERAASRAIELRGETPKDLEVLADRRALEQILANLLENAIKYGGEGAVVRVTGAPDGEKKVRIEVHDTGPGIDAKHLPRLFERFYRVDKGRSREEGGTGLGLSIVKNLAEAMDGSVAVESSPGQGSTFIVSLPA